MTIDVDSLLDNIFGGVYYVDKERKIKYWNKEAERITGYSREEVVGHYCYDEILQHINDEGINLCFEGCPLQAAVNDGKRREAEVYLHHKDGHRIPVIIRAVPIKGKDDKIIGAVELFLENKKSKTLEEKLLELKKENYRDELTKISNRKYLESILEELLSRKNIENENIVFCFLDIDDFKNINDNYGHLIGDRVLSMAAKTLDNNIRPSDKTFRWGGDEFALILFGLDNKESVGRLLNRLKSLVNNSYLDYEDKKISITISFGATRIKRDDSIKSLTKRADNNMYESKKKGKNKITFS
jgi:diguanylate cyclase (GGDEF)-like protein/PAS domain S-box-containing protein